MTRVLIDVNVILDVLLEREPHVHASSSIWSLVETGKVEGLLSAHAITTIHYIVAKAANAQKAKRVVRSLLTVFGIADVNREVVKVALDSIQSDFEDAVTAAAAGAAVCSLIITRDPKGFRNSAVQAVTPEAGAHILSLPT